MTYQVSPEFGCFYQNLKRIQPLKNKERKKN